MATSFAGYGEGGAIAGPLALFVSFDGLRPDALQRPETPSFNRLLSESAYTLSAVVDYPWTLPSHVSMFSGLRHDRHGVSWDFYDPQRGPVQVPTLFTLTLAQGIRTALISGKQKFAHLNRPGTIDTVLIDEEVRLDNTAQVDHELLLLARSVELMRGSDYGLVLLHVALLDWFGHVHQWMSPEYLKAVGVADLVLGRILAFVESLLAAGRRTLLIVTADHGGHGRVHDDPNLPEDCLVPWVAFAPGLVRRGPIVQTVRNCDSAAVLLDFLGLPYLEGWDARPVAGLWADQAGTAGHGR